MPGGGDILRYAPVMTNLAQMAATIGRRPEVERPYTVAAQPVNEKMNYTPMDSMYMANQMQQQGAGIARQLQSNSLGNSSLANQLLLSQNRGNQDAVANAMMQMQQLNEQRRNQAKSFNADVASRNAQTNLQAQQFNAQSRVRTDEINAANRAALMNQRSGFLSGIGTNLGQIGTENRWMDIAPNIYWYDDRGRYTGKKCKGGKINKMKK